MLFVCHQCGCVDAVELTHPHGFPSSAPEQLCAYCLTGSWHEVFLRVPYEPERDLVCNRPTGVGLS